MIRLIPAIALGALFATQAPAQNHPFDGMCDDIATLSQHVMFHRQHNDNLSELMGALLPTGDDQADKIVRAIIIDAYKLPRYRGQESRADAISEFTTSAHVECLIIMDRRK
jgi:hypothetical protein